jgi:hypothetical protein
MKSKGSSGKTVEHNRSAKTGQYVTPEYAKRHPATTVTEHDKIPGKKK